MSGSVASAAGAQEQSGALGDDLQADAFKRLYPRQYFDRFVQEGIRPDGRTSSTCRPVTIGLRAVGNADGSALVKLGSTTVLAGVRLEVMVPASDAPDRGQLSVSVEITPLSTPEWRPGRPPPAAHVLAARLSDLLLAPGVLDDRQLCISPGQAAWVLFLDLYVLGATGGLLDACLLAALAALRDARLPAVHVTPEGNVERGADPDGGGSGSDGDGDRRLEVGGGAALALTLGLYGGRWVSDPNHEEEVLMGALVSTAVSRDGMLAGVYKWGGSAAVEPPQLLAAVEVAKRRVQQLFAQLDAALQLAQEGEQAEEADGGEMQD